MYKILESKIYNVIKKKALKRKTVLNYITTESEENSTKIAFIMTVKQYLQQELT